MNNILSSLGKTVLSGFFLVLLIVIFLSSAGLTFDHSYYSFLFRWLHVLSGIMWIGLFGILILFKYQICQIYPMNKNRYFESNCTESFILV